MLCTPIYYANIRSLVNPFSNYLHKPPIKRNSHRILNIFSEVFVENIACKKK